MEDTGFTSIPASFWFAFHHHHADAHADDDNVAKIVAYCPFWSWSYKQSKVGDHNNDHRWLRRHLAAVRFKQNQRSDSSAFKINV